MNNNYHWTQKRKYKKNHKRQKQYQEGGNTIAINSYLSWYYNLYAKLAKAELEEEKKDIYRRIQTWPLSRLINEGYVLLECRAKVAGKLLGDTIIKFTHVNRSLPFTRFMNGDIISITQLFKFKSNQI